VAAAGDEPQARPARAWQVPGPAALGAAVLVGLSLSPSLMPRSGVIQGLICGLAAATGYGLGLLVAWLVREVTGRRAEPSRRSPRTLRIPLLAGAGTLAVLAVLGKTWQDEVRVLMGSPVPGFSWYPQALLVALLVLVLLVGVARLIRRAALAAGRVAGRHMPPRAGRAVGALLIGGLTIAVLDGILTGVAYPVLDRAFRTVNAVVDPDVAQPASDHVSGSSASAVRWEDLGSDGRDFIAEVPTAERIATVARDVSAEPIRVFVGIESSDDPVVRAELALADLEAFGAFERSVLVVATSTGTGWIDQRAVEPIELMYGGDSAIVSTQYSHLPSWLSFLVDQERARQAARTLFDAIYARWVQLPEESRPTLLVFGESLGSFGAESAFTGVTDMATRSDGALLVGPPQASPLHRAVTESRDPGTPEWQPVVDGGQTLRFGRGADDLRDLPGEWPAPRLVYLQNPSDPVVWWSPQLLLTRPDWLAEPRGPDVSEHMRWWPILTFLQLTGDMMDSTSVPAGHGHVYGYNQAAAWTLIAPPPGWTGADTERLLALYR
jgi:uncharacterized membrane protein